MATPTYSEVIQAINTFIVTNHNNEITAEVLNPILVLLTDFTNNTIGDLESLTTDQKETVVAAINSLKININDIVNNGVQLYTGMPDPNVTPPPTYKAADFYLQVDFDSLPVQLWQFNGDVWTSGGTVFWGGITGSIEDQTDLVTYIADKNDDTLNDSKTYSDGLVVGLLDDRGGFDASSNQFPITGGSGTSGEILKGDLWFVTAAGLLGGTPVNVGDSFRAIADNPAQDPTKWNIISSSLGYLAENQDNKQNSMLFDGTGVKYPTVDAVNIQANNISRALMNIGLLDVTSDDFNMARLDDTHLAVTGTSIGVVFPNYFDTPPFSPSEAVKQIPTMANYPLQNFLAYLPTSNTQGVFYIGWRDTTQTIELSTIPLIQNNNVFQMGVIYLKNVSGTISFIDANRTVLVMPDVSQYSNLETTAIGVSSGMSIFPNANMTIGNIASSIIGISVNYKGSNNDERPVAAENPTTFTRLSPANANAVSLPAPTTIVSTTDFYNPATGLMQVLASNTRASVQRWLLTVRGTFILQAGEVEYLTITAAKNAVYTATFTDFLPKGTFVEIARMAAIKATADLSNNADCSFYATGKGGGGSSTVSSVSFSQIQGFAEDNINLNNSLLAKANDNNVVHLSGSETITGVKTVAPAPNVTAFIIDLPLVDNNPPAGVGVPDAHVINVRGHNGLSENLVWGLNISTQGNKAGGVVVSNLNSNPAVTNSVAYEAYFQSGSVGNFIFDAWKGSTNVFQINDNGELLANKIGVLGGSPTDFLKADGSKDSNTYDALEQITVSGNATVQESWRGKPVLFTASCTITVPATLSKDFAFQGVTLLGVTITWAITTPKIWLFGTPQNTLEKSTFSLMQQGETSNIILLQ